MKEQIRVLGIDDSPFEFRDKRTDVIGVVMRIPSYIEAVMRTDVAIDGNDASEKLIDMVEGSRYKEQLRLVMLDGAALGGFNIVDIVEFHEATKIPIATITRDKPDLESVESALKNHFQDWEMRLDLMKRGELIELKTEHNPIFVKFCGISLEYLENIIKSGTVLGALPEAIRVAHLIASGIKSGESHGRA
jgi:endonuclease V-like protein UPF0215 family